MDEGGRVGQLVGHRLPDVPEVPRAHRSLLIPGLEPTLAGVDFALPAEDDPRRTLGARLAGGAPGAVGRQLAERGLVAPHWPPPWGLGADPTHQLIVDDELRRAGVAAPTNTIGIGWAGPTILYAGTAEQKDRYLMPLLAGEEIWCQLFSEPGAGSDLASLTTRADLDGDQWVVRGQKVWTSYAHGAQFGILLARTEPDAPVHQRHLLLHLPDGRPRG